MGFERVYITKQGALLAAKTLQGKKIEFDHAEIGSGNLSGNAVDKTSLTTKVLECPIQKVEITEDTQAKVSFIFKNTDAKSAFYFREIQKQKFYMHILMQEQQQNILIIQ